MQTQFTDAADCVPAAPAKILALEQQYRVRLPSDYWTFLTTSGGGHPVRDFSPFGSGGDCVAHIYGLHEGSDWKRLDYAIRDFGHDLSVFLPIAVSNGGNYFILRVTEPGYGVVYFWDHELEASNPPTFDSIIRVAGSFKDWMETLENPDEEKG